MGCLDGPLEPPKTVTILGKRWRLEFTDELPGNRDADCDPPSAKGRVIRIHKKRRGERLMELLLHEMLHAAGWHIDEMFIRKFSADAARVLTRLGYKEG